MEKISSAAVYLSNVTGKDLNSSMTTLLGTYNGTTTQLKKLGIDVVRANRKGKIRVSRKGTMNSQEKRDIKPY